MYRVTRRSFIAALAAASIPLSLDLIASQEESWGTSSMAVQDGGKLLYVTTEEGIYEYELSVPHDITTAGTPKRLIPYV